MIPLSALRAEHEVIATWDDWTPPRFECACGADLMVEGKSWWSVYVDHLDWRLQPAEIDVLAEFIGRRIADDEDWVDKVRFAINIVRDALEELNALNDTAWIEVTTMGEPPSPT